MSMNIFTAPPTSPQSRGGAQARIWVLMMLLVVFVTISMSAPRQTRAQTEGTPEIPLVVFIEEPRNLQTSSVTDPGPDGSSRLAEVFRAYGARTQFVPLEQAIPRDADVIVLIRPRRGLSPQFLARIYTQIENGANLLLAIDPLRHQTANPDNGGSGIARIIGADYGIGLLDVFLVEPYFTAESTSDLRRSYSQVFPDSVGNPVSATLQRYNIPLQVWGARALSVAALGADSAAFPLIYTDSAYGETTLVTFFGGEQNLSARQGQPTPTPIPPGYQIDLDLAGRLNVGAAGVNLTTNTRAVVFADGEIFQNDYGLARSFDGRPINPGNAILAANVAGWLLELDPAAYSDLPAGFTYLNLDGDGADWDATIPAIEDTIGDTSLLGLDIVRARAFRNNHYLYLLIETSALTDSAAQLTMELDTDADGMPDTALTLLPGTNAVQARRGEVSSSIPDAEMQIGANGIEVRLPIREVGALDTIPNLCVQSGIELAFPPPPDCVDFQIPVRVLDQDDLAPVRMAGTMLAKAFTVDVVNLREGPSTDFRRVALAVNGDLFSVVGRNEAGDWLLLQNAAVQGWAAAQLMNPNGDISALPVIETP